MDSVTQVHPRIMRPAAMPTATREAERAHKASIQKTGESSSSQTLPTPSVSFYEVSSPLANALNAPRQYVLATGLSGQARLEVSESIYGPQTRRLFADLRQRYFTPNQSIDMAVFGCGSGAQIPALHDFVGPQGSLWLTDNRQEQLDLARERVTKECPELAVTYAVCDVHAIVPPRLFDVAYARFLLVHLKNPSEALRNMSRCLRPGGLLVCDEHDVSDIRSCPSLPAPEHFRSLLNQLAVRRGVDFTLGAKLGRLFMDTNLAASDACLWGATLLVHEQPAKSLTALSLAEGRDQYVGDRLASNAEMDHLIAQMWKVTEDPQVTMSVGSQWQMWTQIPNETSPKITVVSNDANDSEAIETSVESVNARSTHLLAP